MYISEDEFMQPLLPQSKTHEELMKAKQSHIQMDTRLTLIGCKRLLYSPHALVW